MSANKIEIANDPIKPFLRWAGGKTWIIKHLGALLPKNGFNAYHEPFLGGGAVFFSLTPDQAYLSDSNADLIDTYKTLCQFPLDIISILKKYENNEEKYYSVRSSISNDPILKAANFIYLNQTSYNGIYRVNLKGQYNVPYGYRNVNFCNPENINNASRILSKANIFVSDFEAVKDNLKKKDLVFLDPPYTVSHNLNGFIKYNQKLFSLDDQKRLAELIDYIKSKDAYYILTNAAHEKIIEIFEREDKILEFNRANLIGGTNAKRGQTSEYVFTNIMN